MSVTMTLSALCMAIAALMVASPPASLTPATKPVGSVPGQRGVGAATLAPYQIELIALANEAASAVPISPHIKERSRQQEAVVVSCLKLGETDRAKRVAGNIANWQRGLALARIAAQEAKVGNEAEARRLIESAVNIAANEEDWRRDQVRASIAQAYEWLGDNEQVARFIADLVSSETGIIEVVRAQRIESAMLSESMSRLDALVRSGNFDLMRNAIEAYLVLHEKFYSDSARRIAIETAIDDASRNLPVILRIDVHVRVASTATTHSDLDSGRKRLEAARGLLDGHDWLPEDRVSLMARLAIVRHRLGEHEEAIQDINSALAHFLAEREQILNMHRGRALRPLAETYKAMGQTDAALRMYRQIVEEGAENPNARPRAMDLVATCLSMAENEIEPDAALWRRLRELQEGLVDPW